MPWNRHRRSSSRLGAPAQATAWQVVSLLLDYPDETLVGRVPMLTDAVAGLPDDVRMPLSRFLAHVASADLEELQRAYVDTFDVTRRCCLHLTYYLHGDTRNRGAALVRIKQDYRRAGGVLTDEDAELPDHLTVVLEFGASVDAGVAWRLLNDHRVGIELLRLALSERRSPWLDVVDALRATLPRLVGDDEEALARLVAEGPPEELVGLSTEMDAPYARPGSEPDSGPAGPGPVPVTIGARR
ncbi:nitrate reductase molybdenum cofactor assembly chaperone [Knoellia locipacati]|uniref:Nitrate reductase molybdenum cofactor assembly chaperone n=1 Tax=Knoellia locipacati TaxID=882824 RepID=A0A512SY35_9MICO|nr:nitrate reductase molybdenum cofactor assembly chaperone [Knoellia locipacati]GEQ12853.1 nitrate reductase molybdenum cofactor assembly chaperone [Knoellia locipacati]